MASESQGHTSASKTVEQSVPEQQEQPVIEQPLPLSLLARQAQNNPQRLSQRDILQLQRTIGNQAVMRLLPQTNQPVQRLSIAEEEAEELPQYGAAARVQRTTQVESHPVDETTFRSDQFSQVDERAMATAVLQLATNGGPRGRAMMTYLDNPDETVWGFTWPESLDIELTAKRVGDNWVAVAQNVTGHYSILARLLPGVNEVANTTAANYQAQLRDLRNLTHIKGDWFMLAAVRTHENVHADHLAPALAAVEPYINTQLEGVTTPYNADSAASIDAAVPILRALPGFATAQQYGLDLWTETWNILKREDHAGAADAAEHTIVDPKIAEIEALALANGWGG
jgi:hypothetical protein